MTQKQTAIRKRDQNKSPSRAAEKTIASNVISLQTARHFLLRADVLILFHHPTGTLTATKIRRK
jgi:hypothetical protein